MGSGHAGVDVLGAQNLLNYSGQDEVVQLFLPRSHGNCCLCLVHSIQACGKVFEVCFVVCSHPERGSLLDSG